MTSPDRPRSLAFALAALPAALLLATGSISIRAQDGARPAVRVSPVLVVEPEVETALAIEIQAAAQVPPQSFLRIRGLPQSAKLSEGHLVSPGIWAVPLAALASLRLIAPLAGSGRSELSLALMGVDGAVIAESRSSLVVAPAWLLGNQRNEIARSTVVPSAPAPVAMVAPPAPPVPAKTPPPAAAQAQPAPAAPAVKPPPAQPAPVAAIEPPRPAPAVKAPPPPAAAPAPAVRTAPPALSQEDRTRAEDMVRRGETFLSQGNVAAARQFFRRAADIGLALGALRLGATYDPVEMTALRATGLQADPKEARTWYERARALGAPEAASRLSRLGGQ